MLIDNNHDDDEDYDYDHARGALRTAYACY